MKIAAAASIGCLLAVLFQLQTPTSAGIIAILSLQNTLVSNTVLVLHLYAAQSVHPALLVNELLLLLTGTSCGILMNLYMPGNSAKIRRAQSELEQIFRNTFHRIARDIVMDKQLACTFFDLSDLDLILKKLEKEAHENQGNTLLSDEQYFVKYVEREKLMKKYSIAATTDIGVSRERQEDYIFFKELDEKNLFCVIADGTGSRPSIPQPASIICLEIGNFIQTMWKNKKKDFCLDPKFYMKLAMLIANKVIGAFKMGNEELYSGFAASVTCCLFTENNQIFIAHCGNTRVYMLRNGVLTQLTKDYTKANELLNMGKITKEEYYVHADRLLITNGIGLVTEPEIQLRAGRIKDDDIILMTTDGVHYAIQPQAMAEIILKSQDCEMAAYNLVDAAKNIIKYPDNMSAMVLCTNQ